MTKIHFTLSKYRTPMFLVLALLVLYVISRYNYNLFHSLADGVSIVIAACVFTIIWNGRRIVDNDYFLYVGIAFLFFAFWDLLHLLGNKNMGVFPQYGNLGPALYIVSRYILSISLLIAPLFINRKLNTTLMYAAYSLVTLLILLSIFSWYIFPVCIVDGVGLTPFKVVSDYIICLILLGAIGLLLINRRSFDSRVLRLIVSSIILSIATGLAFTLYADPFGIMNAIGHFFQIASFYLIYLAFIETSLTKPQDILYQKLKKNEEILTEYVNQLNDANAVLEKEVAERKQAEEALLESHSMLERNLKGSIEVISKTIERKGACTPGYHRRVAALASAIAQEMKLTDFQVQGIGLAAAVYDIGLIDIPIEFLQDTDRLEGLKLAMYQSYPQTGHDTLMKIEFPWPIAEIILHHRECFDGSGFPRGLKGEATLIEAKILAVTDALEGLTSHLVNRSAFPISEALEKISSQSGSKYDPDVVAACLKLFKEKGYKMES
jgi:HD-GYP domain-containing protein (c-di-GMP phosphodiesterase class II)